MKCFLGSNLYGPCMLLWGLIVLNAIAKVAYARIEPGSGLLRIQNIGSTLAGTIFQLRKGAFQLFARSGKHAVEAGSIVATAEVISARKMQRDCAVATETLRGLSKTLSPQFVKVFQASLAYDINMQPIKKCL
jgi:hypothetical protein